jgi:hypothetical protein
MERIGRWVIIEWSISSGRAPKREDVCGGREEDGAGS